MIKTVKSINIITSPFGCIPPHAIGAVEKRWKSCGDYYAQKELKITHICKRPGADFQNDDTHIYIKGYGRTGSWGKDFLLDLVYSVKALWKMPKCDAVVLNTIWSPILLPFFKHKYKVSLYNVARFPKRQFGFYKAVDVLSCVSRVVYNCLLEQTPKSKKQACVISNFIDTNIYHPYKEHQLTETKPTILFTGRVHREKGVELLVKAINQIRKNFDVTLKIIGAWDTPRGGSGKEYKDELDKLADGWKINWVDPIYDPQELAKEMDTCDVYCYPSLADKGETFGVAPLEAMGLGIPTVVSSLDCFKDFLTDKVSGLVFDHRSDDAVEQLTSCLRYILESKEHYAELSKNAIAASASFNVAQKAEEYLLVLNNELNFHKTGFDDKANCVKEMT